MLTKVCHKFFFYEEKYSTKLFSFNFDSDTFAYDRSFPNLNEPLTRIKIFHYKNFFNQIFFTFFAVYKNAYFFPIKNPKHELKIKKKVFLSNFSSIFKYL